jgi:ADP-heptose:LPS heptosyltransferase
MKVVVPSTSVAVPVEHGRRAIQLTGGVSYVMHDVEAAGGARAGILGPPREIPARPARYAAGTEARGSLVLPFIGGLGDAVAMLPVLQELRSRHPGLRITAAPTPGPAEVFQLSGIVAATLPYPPTLAGWQTFDHHLTMEVVHETGQQPGRPLAETFAHAIGLELGRSVFDLRLPGDVEAAARREGEAPLVGVAVGQGRSLRAYPLQALRSLVAELGEAGIHCVLFGEHDPDWTLPAHPRLVTDMRSRTATVLELATWLSAMDVVATHDSFVMHLAGALGRPLVALFAPTSGRHAPGRPDVRVLSSDATCAPCHAAVDECPLGHERCRAWEAAPVAPSEAASEVLALLERSIGAGAVLAGGADRRYNGAQA